MASFSKEFPYAIHVLPLHAWKSIRAHGLLSKKDRDGIGLSFERRSSGEVDRALGFTDHVHFYLAREGAPKEAPILASKMNKKKPFPHLALRISTRSLVDEGCLLTCWNIAKGRPGVGFWPPSFTPAQIREEWDRFRASRPGSASRGSWVDAYGVPVLTPRDFVSRRALLSDAKELLLPSAFKLEGVEAELWSFSSHDSRSLMLAGAPNLRLLSKEVKNYTGVSDDPVNAETRRVINEYLEDASAPFPQLDFD
jgi:hypothetical protein